MAAAAPQWDLANTAVEAGARRYFAERRARITPFIDTIFPCPARSAFTARP
jgi:hypothetical protein